MTKICIHNDENLNKNNLMSMSITKNDVVDNHDFTYCRPCYVIIDMCKTHSHTHTDGNRTKTFNYFIEQNGMTKL